MKIKTYKWLTTVLLAICHAMAVAGQDGKTNCLIMGDSIAVGLGRIAKECESIAQVKATSKNYFDILEKFEPNIWDGARIDAGRLIISLGAFDEKSAKTYEYLLRLRAMLNAHQITWVVPQPGKSQDKSIDVLRVAAGYGDQVVYIKPQYLSRDGRTPTIKGYMEIIKSAGLEL